MLRSTQRMNQAAHVGAWSQVTLPATRSVLHLNGPSPADGGNFVFAAQSLLLLLLPASCMQLAFAHTMISTATPHRYTYLFAVISFGEREGVA
ncbi:hypothetical protein GQ54DRAFT_57729 [Martensiomyces pterosporus]|nr:hypothetical protein GQ54DRAFT_57729 [Martensiomyces pterosporus]